MRVATYRRASTDEENQPYSLDAQRTKLESWVVSQDDMVLVHDYEEYASGKDTDSRPQLLKLLEDAATGKFDMVVVHKVDRWSRRLSDLLATLEFLEDHQVAFASATEPIDTTDLLGRMFLQILGSFAEYERGIMEHRVRQGIAAKLARGLPLANVGYGLAKDARGVVIPDPVTFAVVERVFREYTADQLGTKAIATGLQKDGLPPPGRRPWSAPAVARILRNRTYIGELPYGDDWVEGAHDALLDRALFDAAQDIADRRSSQSGAARTKGDFVLSGTIYCGHCGGKYNGSSGTSRNKTKVRYYQCSTFRKYGKDTCAAPSVPADDLERLVADALVDTYADTDLFAQAIEAHLAQQEQRAAQLAAEVVAARATAAEKQRVIDRYQGDYEAGRLDAELYSSRTAELRTDLQAAAIRIAQLELELQAVAEDQQLPTEADRERLHTLLSERIQTGPVPVRKALFIALVERLEVHTIDDIRPTFKLGGPALPDFTTAHPDREGAAASDAEQASEGLVFASRTSGWS